MEEIVDVICEERYARQEPIACPLCGRNNTPRRIGARFGMVVSVAECPPCRLAYQTPRPSEAATAAYMNWRWDSGDRYVADTPGKRKSAQRQMASVRKAHPSVRSLLDFGAGSGAFVRAAKDAGVDAIGVEQSESAIELAQEFYDVQLLRDLPDARYDVVTLWDVVEHLRDPVAVLGSLRERLHEGGSLIMATGNYECWQRRIAQDDWGLYLLDHHFYFTPTSLDTVCRRAGYAGFKLLDVNHARPPLRRLFKDPAWYARALRERRSTMATWPEHGDIHIMIGVATR